MTLVKDISPTGIKAMRERISAEVWSAHTMNRIAVQRRNWGRQAYELKQMRRAAMWLVQAEDFFDKRDDHMDAARRCKCELEHVKP